MAAWGTRNFENDESQDWVFDLIDNKDGGLVADTLQHIINREEYLILSDCTEALAAAEVVAALTGKPSEDFPEKPLDGLDSLDLLATKALRQLAVTAVQKIVANSGAKDQWEESNDLESWLSVQEDLLKRLQ